MNDWFEAEQRVERAQQLSESLRWEEALEEIDVALSINPANAVWHAHRGFILEELERWADAADAYEAVLELDPGDRDVAAALGAALTRLGRFARALEIFDELGRLYPDFEAAYCHRINLYAKLGRHEQAEEMFYLAQELDDSCPHCFYYIGSSLLARGQTERALYCWQRVLDLDPDYIGVNRRIAQAHRAQGDLEAAREYYLRSVRDDPGDTDVLFEFADLTLEADDLATAGAKFAQILELDPDHLPAHFALGTIWLRRGQPGQALACFEAIGAMSDMDPGLPGFRFRMGAALFQLARFTEARESLEIAVEEEPDKAAWVLLGDCLLAMGKDADAANAFRRALVFDADDVVPRHKLAMCLLRDGRPETALEHSLHAIRTKPDFEPAVVTAVVASLRLARWREARTLVKKTLMRNPDHSELRRLGGRIWRYRLGHYGRKLAALFRRDCE